MLPTAALAARTQRQLGLVLGRGREDGGSSDEENPGRAWGVLPGDRESDS